ncbi:MAG TPA: HypC/HybG/HupF family hydrogenase formation chaperone [Euryarchaeota archaeon]|nr:hydrogenase isoenzymes formation protein HypC [archaeon BMS3Abin16]GBE56841.1 hydrogenase isoenzymes formation protein HypC [archaeon BMS3Bbin16]HDH27670.1 HypC/HybG/HupF family hydrogenase formation chaperone [Euryarchaeota archaeon]HDH28396.1 HypC/HybG/HupF family hydrogenase formation chaperone [Euryarchaeota archaeon]
MCLAIPGEIVEMEGEHATVDFGGTQSKVNIAFIPDLKAGDYVIVHVGYAIQKMTRDEAEESLRLINEVLEGA